MIAKTLNVWRTKGFIPEIDDVICNFSYGLGSYCAAKRMVDEFGPEKVTLLFADVKAEDEDTYKWGHAAAKTLGCKLIEISEGRTPWQVFEDSNFIGNSRVDMCSRILKRLFINKYLEARYNNQRTLLVFGIHWSESDRYERIVDGKLYGVYWRLRDIGWRYVRAPLCETPFISVEDMEKIAADAGLWKQQLYVDGFSHANCAGECVKQGQAGWRLLYEKRRGQFERRRDWEEIMRRKIGKDVSILRETVNGRRIPLTLATLQERIDAGIKCDNISNTMSGCTCFSGEDE